MSLIWVGVQSPEKASVHNKIMQNWDSERRQIKAGARKIILKAYVKGGVRVSEATVKRIAREAKGQEEESEKHFLDNGEVKGMDHGASRKGWTMIDVYVHVDNRLVIS